MYLNSMKLYNVYRGADSAEHVRVLINKGIADGLIQLGYAKPVGSLEGRFVSIILSTHGHWEIISSSDQNYTYCLSPLNVNLVDALKLLKKKLVVLGCAGLNQFEIPGVKAVRLIGDVPVGGLMRRVGSAHYMLSREEFDELSVPGRGFKRTGGSGDHFFSVVLDKEHELFSWAGDGACQELTLAGLTHDEKAELDYVKTALTAQDKTEVGPFALVTSNGNGRRYVVLSREMAEKLSRHPLAGMLDNLERCSGTCVIRLTDEFRLFVWSIPPDLKVTAVAELTAEERKRYDEAICHLAKLGFGRKAEAIVKAVAEEQSWTDALYQDRKRAALKAAQSIILKDVAVNTLVDASTKSDRMMRDQRSTLISGLPARCCNTIGDIDSITRRFGWSDTELEAAAMKLKKACREFEKLYNKKHPKV
jgi:hypothetical protein